MKIYRKEEAFKPIIVEIQTEEEARFLLAVFNRAPSALEEALENEFTADEIIKIFGRDRDSKYSSSWDQLNKAMGREE